LTVSKPDPTYNFTSEILLPSYEDGAAFRAIIKAEKPTYQAEAILTVPF
jgi:hypothetical protein